MPKSGSHLVLQILQGIYQIAPFRHIQPFPIRMITPEGRNRTNREVRRDLQSLKPGVIGWGYLRSDDDFLRFFSEVLQVKSFFVYRDPRDRLISSIFYAVDIHKGHAQHEFYTKLDLNERIKVAITGRDEPGLLHLPNIREHYDRFLGWLDHPQVLCMKFEEIIHHQNDSLNKILDYLEEGGVEIPGPRDEALTIVREAIQPKKSPTFRQGKSGGWREHFNEEHKQLFKDIAGDLLITLGYEENHDW
jgi:hypothetical protein